MPGEPQFRVKIYVAAGRITPTDSDPCRHLSVDGCRLYEVDWPIPPGTTNFAPYVRELNAPVGSVKPDVNHRHPLVAYSGFSADVADELIAAGLETSDRTRIGVLDLESNQPLRWTSGSSLNGTTWPSAKDASCGPIGRATAWAGPRRLLFNRQDRLALHLDDPGAPPPNIRYEELWSVDVERKGAFTLDVQRERWYYPNQNGPVLDAPSEWCSLSWPSPNPVRPEQVAIHSNWDRPVPTGNPDPIGIECPWVVHAGPKPSRYVKFPAVGVALDLAAADFNVSAGYSAWQNRSVKGVLQKSWKPIDFFKGEEHSPPPHPLTSDNDPAQGLAHPDWSSDGDYLLFFEQEGPRLYNMSQHALPTYLVGHPPYSPAAATTESEYSRVWAYERSGAGTWQTPQTGATGYAEPMYRHPTPAELEAMINVDLFPMGPRPGACVRYVHKYARFCATPGDASETASPPFNNDFIVVNVYCADRDAERYQFSRTFLVDVTGWQHGRISPTYYDLTSIIERATGHHALGRFQSTFADCGPWYISRTGPQSVYTTS